MRRIGVVTVARSDYGIYRPVLKRIMDDPDLELVLIVGGMHLSEAYGLTVREIEKDGFPIAARVPMMEKPDNPKDIARSMGMGLEGFSAEYARLKPDMLVVLGDRFEMHAAALAALPFLTPLAHIHGGELTLGAYDDALRHSITKLSHLHFPAAQEYADRIRQLGEEDWRITVSGAPGLDNIKTIVPMDGDSLFKLHSVNTTKPFLLVTFHPVTLEYKDTASHVDNLLAALDRINMPMVFTMPAADTKSATVIEKTTNFIDSRDNAMMVTNLGTEAYFGVMNEAAAMVGNSSSGIIEAASFKLPVVNIGTRQAGRMRAANVIDVDYATEDIVAGIEKAVSPEFTQSLKDLINPFGQGDASQIIVDRLKTAPLNSQLTFKGFVDIPAKGVR